MGATLDVARGDEWRGVVIEREIRCAGCFDERGAEPVLSVLQRQGFKRRDADARLGDRER